jgi:5'-nucleotidase
VKVLVTNDDGIYAEGLWALRDALAGLGEVIVIAPDRPRSASGHAITLHKPLRIRKRSVAAGMWGYSTNGTPSDSVVLGIVDIVGSPDLVVAGINAGANLGEDLTYSGTVCAAMEAALFGVPAFSISVASDEVEDFGPAAGIARALAEEIGKRSLPPDTFLNVNVPALPAGEIAGVAVTRQGRRRYLGRLEKRLDPRGEAYYWLTGDLEGIQDADGTDVQAVARGFASVTPIHLDLTDHGFMDALNKWDLFRSR